MARPKNFNVISLIQMLEYSRKHVCVVKESISIHLHIFTLYQYREWNYPQNADFSLSSSKTFPWFFFKNILPSNPSSGISITMIPMKTNIILKQKLRAQGRFTQSIASSWGGGGVRVISQYLFAFQSYITKFHQENTPMPYPNQTPFISLTRVNLYSFLFLLRYGKVVER